MGDDSIAWSDELPTRASSAPPGTTLTTAHCATWNSPRSRPAGHPQSRSSPTTRARPLPPTPWLSPAQGSQRQSSGKASNGPLTQQVIAHHLGQALGGEHAVAVPVVLVEGVLLEQGAGEVQDKKASRGGVGGQPGERATEQAGVMDEGWKQLRTNWPAGHGASRRDGRGRATVGLL